LNETPSGAVTISSCLSRNWTLFWEQYQTTTLSCCPFPTSSDSSRATCKTLAPGRSDWPGYSCMVQARTTCPTLGVHLHTLEAKTALFPLETCGYSCPSCPSKNDNVVAEVVCLSVSLPPSLPANRRSYTKYFHKDGNSELSTSPARWGPDVQRVPDRGAVWEQAHPRPGPISPAFSCLLFCSDFTLPSSAPSKISPAHTTFSALSVNESQHP
jgi:hypothetical protein